MMYVSSSQQQQQQQQQHKNDELDECPLMRSIVYDGGETAANGCGDLLRFVWTKTMASPPQQKQLTLTIVDDMPPPPTSSSPSSSPPPPTLQQFEAMLLELQEFRKHFPPLSWQSINNLDDSGRELYQLLQCIPVNALDLVRTSGIDVETSHHHLVYTMTKYQQHIEPAELLRLAERKLPARLMTTLQWVHNMVLADKRMSAQRHGW
jgi:hypothetical protein